MPPKTINLVGREEAARRLKAAEVEKAAAAEKLANAGDPRTAPGKDMRWASCDDCGKFGPWGDGEFRYCKDHVPKWLRYLAKTREDEARKASE